MGAIGVRAGSGEHTDAWVGKVLDDHRSQAGRQAGRQAGKQAKSQESIIDDPGS